MVGTGFELSKALRAAQRRARRTCSEQEAALEVSGWLPPISMRVPACVRACACARPFAIACGRTAAGLLPTHLSACACHTRVPTYPCWVGP